MARASLRLSTLVIAASLVCAARGARAQSPEEALAPPRLVHEATPSYPDGAHGDAAVDVELVVDATGAPREVKAIGGPQEFQRAAMIAVLSDEFTPATRDNKPIAARFRVRVTFVEPPRATAPPIPPPPTAPPATATQPIAPPSTPPPDPDAKPPAPSAPRALEVVVEGERALTTTREPAKTTIDAQSLRRVPGAFGDAFRAIETMPGVVPFASGLPYFFVRGALPSSSGYFLDDIRVPFLFHVGAGPGVVNPALVDKLDFYPGGYPASLGHYVGGIVSATTPAPSKELRAEGTLRLYDAGGFVETPFANGRASAFVGGRYSYTAGLLKLAAPTLRLDYWDYQLGASYAITPRDRIGVFAFGSHDHLGKVDPADAPEEEIFGASFHRVALRFEHARDEPDAPRARLTAAIGTEDSAVTDQGNVKDTMGMLRVDATVPVLRELTVRGGAEILIDVFRFEPGPSSNSAGFHGQIVESFASRPRGTMGGWIDAVVRPTPFLELVPGARLDAYLEAGSGGTSLDDRYSVNGTREIDVDPRLAVRIKLGPRVTSVTTLGTARQWPTVLVPIPGLEPRGGAAGLQRVVSESQGVELDLPESILAKLTFFHNGFDNLTDLLATCSAKRDVCDLSDRAGGRAYGLEAQIARPLSKDIGGFVSYTLSRSERSFQGETFVSDLDRTHVLSAALGVRFLKSYHAGVRFTAYSGRPYSLLVFDDPHNPDQPTLIGRRNALRRSWFFRVDARVERSWKIGRSGWIAVVLEAMNVTLAKETIDFDCRVAQFNNDTGGLKCGGQEIGPLFIPSLGLSGGL